MFNLTTNEIVHCRVMKSCLNAIQKEKPLILKGGTALMFGYGLDRFSEDLDFDISTSYSGNGTIKLENILKKSLPFDFKLKDLVLKKDTPSLTRYILWYQYGEITERLKIEVSYRSPVDEKDVFIKEGNKFLSIFQIADFKLNAVLGNNQEERTKARDLFDAVFIMKNYAQKINPVLLDKLSQMDMNKLISRYESAFESDEIMKKHSIDVDEIVLNLFESLKNNNTIKKSRSI